MVHFIHANNCYLLLAGAKFFDIIAKTKRKSKKTKLKAFVANRRKQQVEAVSEPRASAFNMQEDVSETLLKTDNSLQLN